MAEAMEKTSKNLGGEANARSLRLPVGDKYEVGMLQTYIILVLQILLIKQNSTSSHKQFVSLNHEMLDEADKSDESTVEVIDSTSNLLITRFQNVRSHHMTYVCA